MPRHLPVENSLTIGFRFISPWLSNSAYFLLKHAIDMNISAYSLSVLQHAAAIM